MPGSRARKMRIYVTYMTYVKSFAPGDTVYFTREALLQHPSLVSIYGREILVVNDVNIRYPVNRIHKIPSCRLSLVGIVHPIKVKVGFVEKTDQLSLEKLLEELRGAVAGEQFGV